MGLHTKFENSSSTDHNGNSEPHNIKATKETEKETKKQKKEIIDLKEIPDATRVPPILVDRTGRFVTLFQNLPMDIQGVLMILKMMMKIRKMTQ